MLLFSPNFPFCCLTFILVHSFFHFFPHYRLLDLYACFPEVNNLKPETIHIVFVSNVGLFMSKIVFCYSISHWGHPQYETICGLYIVWCLVCLEHQNSIHVSVSISSSEWKCLVWFTEILNSLWQTQSTDFSEVPGKEDFGYSGRTVDSWRIYQAKFVFISQTATHLNLMLLRRKNT